MSTWTIQVSGAQNQGEAATGSNVTTIGEAQPGDFDGAQINSVTVSGSPTITGESANDDIGVRFRIQTDGDVAIYGDFGSDAASMCFGLAAGTATSDVITEGSSPSPAPANAVAADWDEVGWAVNYNAVQMGDSETTDFNTSGGSSFDIVVDYTVAAGEDTLLADNVESASELTSPVIGQVHAFGAAGNLESASELTAPAIGQKHVLLADDVESASELTAPVATESHILLADDVESASEVTAPAIGQKHVLLADDVEGASELTAPAITQVHVLLADDVESASELTAPAAAESNILLADDVESASEVSSPSVGQVHALTATSVESASEVSAPEATDVVSSGLFWASSFWQDSFWANNFWKGLAAAAAPAGKPVQRAGRKRRRLFVDIDGQLFPANDPGHVRDILSAAARLAEENAPKRPTKIKVRRGSGGESTSQVVIDAVAEAQERIQLATQRAALDRQQTQIQQSAIDRQLDIQAEFTAKRRRIDEALEAEDEEAILALLL